MIYLGMHRFITSVAASTTVDVVDWHPSIINKVAIDSYQRYHS